MEFEDDALERLYKRLDLAIFQLANNDPDVKWIKTNE